MPRTIYCIESHEQALGIWRQNGTRNAKLLHIDFHCDQRGLLINRKRQRAYKIWTRFPQTDEGNFLKHAVLEGIIRQMRWVHDDPGGRKDDVKSVKYETDISALIHRVGLMLTRRAGVPFQYEVMKTQDWLDIEPGEILDIDWDYFAAVEYPRESVQPRINDFLSRQFSHIPDETIVCYSPEYSHPTRQEFHEFIAELASRFNATVVEVSRFRKQVSSRSSTRKLLNPVVQPLRQLYHFMSLALRRRGIY